jgi:hypothetical protein
VGGEEDSTKQNAETAHDNVRNAEEGVLAAHDGARGDEDRLGAAVCLDGETCAELAWRGKSRDERGTSVRS